MSAAHKVSLSVAFDLQLDITQEAALELVQHVRKAKITPDEYTEGFLAAASKLADLTDTAEVLRVTAGEVTGHILLTELREFYPSVAEGFTVRVKNAVYLETPPRLDPPADAKPVVVKLGDKDLH